MVGHQDKTTVSIAENLDENPYSITEDDLREKLKKRNWGRFATQFQVAITVAVGTMCFGMVMGWSGPQMKQKLNFLKTKSELKNFIWLPSLVPLGCSVGSGVLSILSRQYGPRKIALLVSPPQCIFWIVIALTNNQHLEYTVMFFSGFFATAYLICGEKLLTECVHAGYLNYFMLFTKLSSGFGILLAFTIGLSFDTDKYYSMINGGLNILQFLLLLWCPESPVFLYEKFPHKAEKVLIYLRGPSHIHEDLRKLRKDVENNNIEVSAKYMLLKRVVYKAIIKIAALRFFQVFSGYYVFLVMSLGFIYLDPREPRKNNVVGQLEDGIIMGSVYFLSSFLFIIHYKQPFGVKKPLIISTSLVTISLLTISIYTYTYDANVQFIRENTWIQLVTQSALIISYHIGLSSYPDFIMFAYLPQQVYNFVKTVSNCFKWFLVFIMVRISIIIQKEFVSLGTTILILAINSVLGIIFCSTCIINSKNKTLLQIQMEIGGNPIGSRRQTWYNTGK